MRFLTRHWRWLLAIALLIIVMCFCCRAGEAAPLPGWCQPTEGIPLTVTDPFGAWRYYGRHEGIDLRAVKIPEYTLVNILAARDGVVSWTGWLGPYGYTVILEHGRWTTWYAHLSDIYVSPGEVLSCGQPLGLAGATGNAHGAHLHFTIQDREAGWFGFVIPLVVDPAPFLGIGVNQ